MFEGHEDGVILDGGWRWCYWRGEYWCRPLIHLKPFGIHIGYWHLRHYPPVVVPMPSWSNGHTTFLETKVFGEWQESTESLAEFKRLVKVIPSDQLFLLGCLEDRVARYVAMEYVIPGHVHEEWRLTNRCPFSTRGADPRLDQFWKTTDAFMAKPHLALRLIDRRLLHA